MKTGWKQLGALLLATCFVGTAQAIPLDDLLEGASITAGDKEFSGWELYFADASDASIDPNLGNIDVTALNDGGLDPGPGLNFNFGNEFTFSGDGVNAFSDLMFGFMVTVLDPGLLIKDVSMTTIGSLTTSGDINNTGWVVFEDVLDDSFFPLGDLLAEFSILDGDLLNDANAGSIDFAGQTSIWVEINIFAFAEQDTDQVNLSSMDLRFSQEPRSTEVPEPGTLALLGLGLIGIGAARRRRL